MKNRARRFLFYFFYIVFGMAITTTALLALQGRCFILDDKKIVYVVCDCPCNPEDRDSTGLYCKRCEHYLTPKDYVVTEDAGTAE